MLEAAEHRHGDSGPPSDLLLTKAALKPEAPERGADLAGHSILTGQRFGRCNRQGSRRRPGEGGGGHFAQLGMGSLPCRARSRCQAPPCAEAVSCGGEALFPSKGGPYSRLQSAGASNTRMEHYGRPAAPCRSRRRPPGDIMAGRGRGRARPAALDRVLDATASLPSESRRPVATPSGEV